MISTSFSCDEMHGGDGHCQGVNHHCRHHNHLVFKFIKFIVDNSNRCQFESLSTSVKRVMMF